jgi:hypothetical protein
MIRRWKNNLIFKFSFLTSSLCPCFFVFIPTQVPSSRVSTSRHCQTNYKKKPEMLSRLMPTGGEGPLDRLCHDLTQDGRLRITVIALDGKVLGDSEQVSDMENHATRPEVAAALRTARAQACATVLPSSMKCSTLPCAHGRRDTASVAGLCSPGQHRRNSLVFAPCDPVRTPDTFWTGPAPGSLFLSEAGIASSEWRIRVRCPRELLRGSSRVHGEDELSVLRKI